METQYVVYSVKKPLKSAHKFLSEINFLSVFFILKNTASPKK